MIWTCELIIIQVFVEYNNIKIEPTHCQNVIFHLTKTKTIHKSFNECCGIVYICIINEHFNSHHNLWCLFSNIRVCLSFISIVKLYSYVHKCNGNSKGNLDIIYIANICAKPLLDICKAKQKAESPFIWSLYLFW